MNLPGKFSRQPVWLDGLRQHGVPEDQVGALRRLVAKAANHELVQANPRYLAERLGLPEREALHLLVTAVAGGLFTLGWQTTCPACDASSETIQNLAEVDNQVQCHFCHFQFVPHLDDEISATVTATAVLRPSEKQHDDPAFRADVDARLGKTPALAMINVPGFRQLVFNQTVPEGQWLGVKRLVIFFSDLRQSTAFYHRRGDADAYHWVHQHFQVMFAAVEQFGGTAVKTIGDGIMGVFTEPVDALNAIAAGMKGLAELNETAGLADDDPLSLKVGIHQGSCIVVTLNGRLDYFGETVNIAARLAGLAQGDDVILSQEVVADAYVCQLTESLGDLHPFASQLSGLPDCFDLYRLTLKSANQSVTVW
ncbi:MAG: adenylate/guanylate cyclase domain-containing protein [Chloroflexi bacterium]|nr:adenylate/guanylate cyclase domain-containing protein [Ardenticatenaceae bacterium]MBL1129396.1 adenylate/guanylate cyclase domain-containing protein [Chloroflexota bacterium]NOG35476.1 adenylate/guanylate cyclase domain-containing protein [Chloroflexota bacterium]GIK57425.1 MAG: guanylate cyclase [Chloroflexota bacterium]